MSNLSDLLNAPSMTATPSAPKKMESSIPPLQIPSLAARASVSEPGEQGPHRSGTTPGAYTIDAAPPVAYGASTERRRSSLFDEGILNGIEPTIRRSSQSSHGQIAGNEGGMTAPSPTLEQYRTSHSPEQARRASMMSAPDAAFKLPPLQTISNAGEETATEDTASKSTGDGPKEASMSTIAQPVKSEVTPQPRSAVHNSIPAFVPPVQLKPEAISASWTASAGDTASPILTTEEPVTEPRGTKRPAPKSKKGVAKKGPATKKQKTSDGPAKSKTKSKAGQARRPLSGLGTPYGSSPAPLSARAASSVARSSATPDVDSDADDQEDEEMGSPDPDADVYCICRKPDTGSFMIGCDGKCDDWYHGKCVGIAEKDKHLIDRYICPVCQENDVGVTTWKRMCRRPGCRMPARLAKKDEEPSKYCSEECGLVFFKDQMQRTRDSTGTSGRKASRAKAEWDSMPRVQDPKGGVISKPELKSLVTSVSTFEAFKALGDGVISPPPTPPPSDTKPDSRTTAQGPLLLDAAQTTRMAEIAAEKDRLRARHALLRDQAKLVNMLRAAGTRAAEAKGLKAREVCGFDERALLDGEAFAEWRTSSEGQSVFSSGVVELPGSITEAGTDGSTATGAESIGPCLRRKCAKHFDWSKLALETNRAENLENGEAMRALDREEKEVSERAGLKARMLAAGEVGGWVESHGAAAVESAEAQGVHEVGLEEVRGGLRAEGQADVVMVDGQDVAMGGGGDGDMHAVQGEALVS